MHLKMRVEDVAWVGQDFPANHAHERPHIWSVQNLTFLNVLEDVFQFYISILGFLLTILSEVFLMDLKSLLNILFSSRG